MAFNFDLFVVGGGSGGVRAARLAAAAGMRVAIAEDTHWGGTCVNVGCVPKKLMKYAATFSHEFEDAAEYGWCFDSPRFDWVHFITIKNAEIARLNNVYVQLLQDRGVHLFNARATLIGPHSLDVGGKTYTAERILLATGGMPAIPDISGAELGISSDDIFFLEQQPKRVVLVGGGYIGTEFASILHGLGTEVIQAYRGEALLKGFDGDLRRQVGQEMQRQGVELRFNTNPVSIEAGKDGLRVVKFDDGHEVLVDQVLFATGRTPRVDNLWSSELDIATAEDGSIQIDDHFRTSVESTYALGDVVGRSALTPVAIAEAKALIRFWTEGKPVSIDYDLIPTAVFCTPMLSTVGKTEEQVKEQGVAYRVYESRFRSLKHTLTSRQEKVYIKMIVAENSNRILGVHMLGPDCAEIMQTVAVALNMGATKDDFDRTIGIHPTIAEELVTLSTARGTQ